MYSLQTQEQDLQDQVQTVYRHSIVYKTKGATQWYTNHAYVYCMVHTHAYRVERTSRGSYARYVRYRTGSSVRYVHYNKQGILEGLPTIVGIPTGTPTGTPSEQPTAVNIGKLSTTVLTTVLPTRIESGIPRTNSDSCILSQGQEQILTAV